MEVATCRKAAIRYDDSAPALSICRKASPALWMPIWNSIGRQIRFLNRQTTIKIAGLYNPLPLTQFAGYSNLGQSLIED